MGMNLQLKEANYSNTIRSGISRIFKLSSFDLDKTVVGSHASGVYTDHFGTELAMRQLSYEGKVFRTGLLQQVLLHPLQGLHVILKQPDVYKLKCQCQCLLNNTSTSMKQDTGLSEGNAK